MRQFTSKFKDEIDSIELREFSEVWDEIKDRIEDLKVENQKLAQKRARRFRISLASSIVACIILICAISTPLMLNNQGSPIIYYSDSLTYEGVSETDFYENINSSVNIIELNRYKGEVFGLYKTDDGEVKGGRIEFFNDLENPMYYLLLKFVSDDVLENDENVYDLSYLANGVNIQYKLKTAENSSWTYIAKANYNSVNYIMEIMSAIEDVTPFFNEFFN